MKSPESLLKGLVSNRRQRLATSALVIGGALLGYVGHEFVTGRIGNTLIPDPQKSTDAAPLPQGGTPSQIAFNQQLRAVTPTEETTLLAKITPTEPTITSVGIGQTFIKPGATVEPSLSIKSVEPYTVIKTPEDPNRIKPTKEEIFSVIKNNTGKEETLLTPEVLEHLYQRIRDTKYMEDGFLKEVRIEKLEKLKCGEFICGNNSWAFAYARVSSVLNDPEFEASHVRDDSETKDFRAVLEVADVKYLTSEQIDHEFEHLKLFYAQRISEVNPEKYSDPEWTESYKNHFDEFLKNDGIVNQGEAGWFVNYYERLIISTWAQNLGRDLWEKIFQDKLPHIKISEDKLDSYAKLFPEESFQSEFIRWVIARNKVDDEGKANNEVKRYMDDENLGLFVMGKFVKDPQDLAKILLQEEFKLVQDNYQIALSNGQNEGLAIGAEHPNDPHNQAWKKANEKLDHYINQYKQLWINKRNIK